MTNKTIPHIMYTQKVLVRPRSSLSNDEHRFKSKLRTSPLMSQKNPSLAHVSLIGACVFLLVLCISLIALLVVIGKNLAIPTSGSKFIRTSKSELHQSTIDYLNEILNSENNKNSEIKLSLEQLEQLAKEMNRLKHENGITGRAAVNDLSKLSVGGKFKMSNSPVAVKIMSKILDKLSFRLPQQIRPTHYNLVLKPDLDKKVFSGNVQISLNISKPISFIPVHAKNLNITKTEVHHVVGDAFVPVQALQNFDYPQHEYWVTEFEKPLDVGQYQLNMEFNSNLANRIVGFYQSSYFDPISNTKKAIATSKFEPTFARQAFPCFDEPQMKATYEVTLQHPNLPGYHALSNMNIRATEKNPENNTTLVHFHKSVPMSTYLACFIVSDFKAKTKQINTGGIGEPFNISVYATPAQIDKVDFALETGKLITEFYIRYFNISYPLPKLDMVAIPDFVSGAMEHWGLVTYRETALLYDETSSTSNKQRAGTTIAHELAHMWFGNLVTMKWWNDLWLNEGFASYIEYKGLQAAYPDWDMLTQFLIHDLHGVLRLDATLASHPIVQVVENPDQITELFDAITYQKGSSIIRMLENFVGEENFQTAVRNYLIKFSYNNAVTDDLLTEMEALGLDFDVKLIMETWTQQMGYPVLTVEKISNSEFKLTQKRFFSNPENENIQFDDSKFNYRWYVPVTFFTEKSSEVTTAWFRHDDAELIVKLSEPVKWIKFNKDQAGFYRVNYPQEMWKHLTEALCKNVMILSTADRAHVLNDAFTLADASQLSYNIALDLTQFLEYEKEYVVWSVASSQLSNIKNLLYYTDIYSDYKEYAKKIVVNAYKHIGWERTENHSQNLLRSTVISLACEFGIPECLTVAQEKFKIWLNNPNEKPDPDVRTAVYYYGMETIGDETEWMQVWKLFVKEEDANEKIKLMSALAAVRQPWLLKKYIDLAWDETYVRRQDYFNCLTYISNNDVGTMIVWDYVRENWPNLVDRFTLNERYLGRLIPSITKPFSTKLKLSEMESFFEQYPEAGAGASARKEALETVKNNIKWLETNKQSVADWLKAHKN